MSGFLQSVTFGILAVPVTAAAVVCGVVLGIWEGVKAECREEEERASLGDISLPLDDAMIERLDPSSVWWSVGCDLVRAEACVHAQLREQIGALPPEWRGCG